MHEQYELHTYTKSKLLLQSNIRNYDIIFLDIEMPEMNGIEIAKKYDGCFDKLIVGETFIASVLLNKTKNNCGN